MPSRITFNRFKAVVEVIKPFFIRPWHGTFALACGLVGLSIVSPKAGSFWGFLWCLIGKWEAKKKYFECSFDGDLVNKDPIGLVVGFGLLMIAVYIFRVNFKMSTFQDPVPQGFFLGIPDDGMTFKQEVNDHAANNDLTVKLIGISDAEYASLYIRGDCSDVDDKETTEEYIHALIARLEDHPFSTIDCEVEGKELVLRAEKQA